MKYLEFSMVLLTVLSCVASEEIYRKNAGAYDSLEENLEKTIVDPNIMLREYADYMNRAKATATGDACAGTGYSCKDCLSPIYCENGVEMAYPTCNGGESCFLDYGIAACGSEMNELCQCGGEGVKACDSYALNNVMTCDDNGPFWSQPCEPKETFCFEGECTETIVITPATKPKATGCDGTNDGLYYVDTSCQEAFLCLGETKYNLENCTNGEYYDPYLGCEPAPPKPCGNNCEGLCPDPVDCTQYHVCDVEGNSLSSANCEEGQKFDQTNRICVAGEVTCPELSACTDYLKPASSTCNANTLGTMHPHEENCKMYYICAKTSAVDYEYVERACISVLVFNPETLKCDIQANVPGCIV